ncbi:MAG: DUF1579 domain-containing protein [Chloroflexota bacterium]
MAIVHAVQTVQDGRADFDFLMGDWKGYNRRLRERLKGSTEWEEFDSEVTVRPILGGLGNFDEVVFNRSTGQGHGATLRLFDIETQQWRIYWADGSHGILDVPMIGTFENGRGEFFAQEMFEGKPIFNRFIWTYSSENACHWEQAFSPDGGKTWETNWTMDFTRIA